MLAVVLQGGFGLASGLYRRRWRYGSFDECALDMEALLGRERELLRTATARPHPARAP